MADKRKTRKRKEEVDEKPTKEEYSVAKYMRSHLPVKKTTLLSHKVEYFIASKAVDCLLESPWATNKKGQETIFTNRESVVEYLNTMLIHKFFHRARKILVSQKDVKSKKKSSGKEKEQDEQSGHAEEGTKEKKATSAGSKKKEKESGKGSGEKQATKAVEGSDSKKQEADSTTKEKKKEKRKIKLDMHLEQFFVDGNEAYVWIYDPIPTTAWLIGGLLVVGAILLCLFPLWPSSVRKGVYYISVAAAGFLCLIVALINIRIIIFCIVWVLTFGKHHLWILPNLTEDVGFFDSFWPLYKYEYKGSSGDGANGSEKSKRRQKDKDSDKEKDSDKDKEEDEDKRKAGSESDREATDSEHDSEDQQQQHSNGDNGFEIVDEEDLEQEPVCKNRKSNVRKERRS